MKFAAYGLNVRNANSLIGPNRNGIKTSEVERIGNFYFYPGRIGAPA